MAEPRLHLPQSAEGLNKLTGVGGRFYLPPRDFSFGAHFVQALPRRSLVLGPSRPGGCRNLSPGPCALFFCEWPNLVSGLPIPAIANVPGSHDSMTANRCEQRSLFASPSSIGAVATPVPEPVAGTCTHPSNIATKAWSKRLLTPPRLVVPAIFYSCKGGAVVRERLQAPGYLQCSSSALCR